MKLIELLKKSSFSRYFKIYLTKLSPVLNTKILFYIKFKRPIKLKNPTTLNEKISWLKLNHYNNDPLVAKCADKYRVREYITECGYPELLNGLIGVFDLPEELPWSMLPNKFAIKYNYGAGNNIICTDKNSIDFDQVLKTIKRWQKSKQHLLYSELQYGKIKRKILVEEFIEGEGSNSFPKDYKLYCFNGVPKYVLVCEGREKGAPKFYFFNESLVLTPLNKDSKEADSSIQIKEPNLVYKMFEYAKNLSKPFPFVRVDFYLSNNKILFGELTFTPSAGMDTSRLRETDLFFGSMLDLPR